MVEVNELRCDGTGQCCETLASALGAKHSVSDAIDFHTLGFGLVHLAQCFDDHVPTHVKNKKDIDVD